MKRLIKKADFYDDEQSIQLPHLDNKYLEIFINPTREELNSIKDDDPLNDMYSGVITTNGLVYMWDGNVEHETLFEVRDDIPEGILYTVAHDKVYITMPKDYTADDLYVAFSVCESALKEIGITNSKPLYIETDYYKAKSDSRYNEIKQVKDIKTMLVP